MGRGHESGGTDTWHRYLTRVGRKRQRVCPGPRIGFLFNSREGHPCYYHRLEYDFSLVFFSFLSSFVLFALSLPLFPFPSAPLLCRSVSSSPSCRFVRAAICPFFSAYAFLLAAFLISLRHLYSVFISDPLCCFSCSCCLCCGLVLCNLASHLLYP